LKAATARRVLPPKRPSISPGEKCARSRRTCALRTEEPDARADERSGLADGSLARDALKAGAAGIPALW
jgi:hypothetical protein